VRVTGQTPTAATSAHQWASPTAGTLRITGEVPTIAANGAVQTSPATGILRISGLAPTLVQTTHATASPANATLRIVGETPTLGEGVPEAAPEAVPSTGGWYGAIRKTRRQREEEELLAEIEALERHIAEERNVAPEVVRIEAKVRAMPYLPKPARKAVRRALRLQTYGAFAHAELVLQRLTEEEEEFAVLLSLALH
jgi:hypothetical protein